MTLSALFGVNCSVISYWRTELRARVAAAETVWLWGAGSKGITFLDEIDRDGAIRRVVDVNAVKSDHYVPGTGQRVDLPRDLEDEPVDTVIAANPIYREEVRNMLASVWKTPSILTLLDEPENAARTTG